MMFLLTFLMPFSKYSQYPVVSRNSANDIKNVELQFLFSRHFERNEVESRPELAKAFTLVNKSHKKIIFLFSK